MYKVKNVKALWIGILVAVLGVVYFAFHSAEAQITIRANPRFTGNLSISGSLSKGGGSFVIDHPLDPANKLLYHSFVESPDVKNIYDGISTLDEKGSAVVKLPDYFEALNGEGSYRFLLTPIGESAPELFVQGSGIKDNSFVIVGGKPGLRVSWQVTGIRQDPYILANPIINEVEKGPGALVDKGVLVSDLGEEEFREYEDF
jgi:hypothetical protein